MLSQADAVIVLPGGVGTMDEQWEIAALLDMDIVARSKNFIKPIIVLSSAGFYNHMRDQMKHTIAEGFTQPGRERIIESFPTPKDVINQLHMWNDRGLTRASDVADAIAWKAEPQTALEESLTMHQSAPPADLPDRPVL